MIKKIVLLITMILSILFCSSCNQSDEGLSSGISLTLGTNIDSAPLVPLSWGMTQEEAVAALGLSEKQAQYMADPYDWMKDEEDSETESEESGEVVFLDVPVEVLGIKAAGVSLQMMDLKGLNGMTPTDLLLSDVYVWYPYENEGSLEAVKKAVTGLYGEPSSVRIQPYKGLVGGEEIPVDPESEAVWYGEKTLHDTLTQESSDYYQEIESKFTPGWGQNDHWEQRLKNTKLSFVELLYSPDQYYNVGQGGYKKQDPPLIEVRFNGEAACIARFLNQRTNSE